MVDLKAGLHSRGLDLPVQPLPSASAPLPLCLSEPPFPLQGLYFGSYDRKTCLFDYELHAEAGRMRQKGVEGEGAPAAREPSRRRTRRRAQGESRVVRRDTRTQPHSFCIFSRSHGKWDPL
ncbi:uncharacterized protein LOC125034341 [Penaeus chinensis]|uniref:uncharacterized protein LOC125034341 n=1 Tax=Penaeus chinensis TaxID=139456 RepID=UPI001FB84520|nr:uncharacterized protein LOC125034341 [Penaeus chinensis]